MNPLQQIEQTYGFQYPKLYHQLYEDGMLDVRWQKERWWEEVFPELKKILRYFYLGINLWDWMIQKRL